MLGVNRLLCIVHTHEFLHQYRVAIFNLTVEDLTSLVAPIFFSCIESSDIGTKHQSLSMFSDNLSPDRCRYRCRNRIVWTNHKTVFATCRALGFVNHFKLCTFWETNLQHDSNYYATDSFLETVHLFYAELHLVGVLRRQPLRNANGNFSYSL